MVKNSWCNVIEKMTFFFAGWGKETSSRRFRSHSSPFDARFQVPLLWPQFCKKASPFHNKDVDYLYLYNGLAFRNSCRTILVALKLKGWTANTKSWGSTPSPRTTSSSRRASTTRRRTRYTDSIISSHKKIHIFFKDH